jgi:hypothetical protein
MTCQAPYVDSENRPINRKPRFEKSIISIIITITRPAVTPDATTTATSFGVCSGTVSFINITVIHVVNYLVYKIFSHSLC